MRNRLKLFVNRPLICPIRGVLGTPAADFERMACPGQNRENGPILKETIESGRVG
jgi:hypothetical protein